MPSLLKLDDEILTLKVPKGCYNSNKSEFITQGYCKIYEDKLANNKTVLTHSLTHSLTRSLTCLQVGYKVRYLSLQNHNANDIRVHNQMLDQYTTVKTIARSRKEKSTHNQEYMSVESSDSSLPWRKPPHPKPKDWPYTSNTDKKTPPATPATPLTATKSTVVLSASTTNSKKSSISKKPSQSQQWQSPSLHNRPAPVKVQEIPKPPLPIEIPNTAFDFVPPPLPYERDTVTAARTTSPLSSPKHSKYTAYQPPSASPRRPPISSQYSDVHQSSLNGIWLDEQDNYSTNNNLYAEYFDLHSDFDNNIEAVITTAPEAIQPRKVRLNTTHVPLTPVMKQQDVDNYYKSQSPYGLLRSIQSKLLNLSHSPRNNVDNTMEELNFPPSYPIPRSNDDSGSIVLNGDIKEALLDLVQRKRNTLEILKSKH